MDIQFVVGIEKDLLCRLREFRAGLFASTLGLMRTTDASYPPKQSFSNHTPSQTDMPNILDVPAELLSIIFELACDADIPTEISTKHPLGFDLAQLCRSFRRVCQADGLDIQYALVRGIKRMRIFLEILRRRSPYAKRIRSLLLAEDYLTRTSRHCSHLIYETSSINTV